MKGLWKQMGAQLTTDKLAPCNPSDSITYTSVKISACMVKFIWGHRGQTFEWGPRLPGLP